MDAHQMLIDDWIKSPTMPLGLLAGDGELCRPLRSSQVIMNYEQSVYVESYGTKGTTS